MSDPGPSVAASQRRLLEAISNYAGDLNGFEQAQIRQNFADGVLTSSVRALEMGDPSASDVFAALSELICAVTLEQLATEWVV